MKLFSDLVLGLPHAKIAQERSKRATLNLLNNSVDVTIGWEYACKSNGSQFVPVLCNLCNNVKLHTAKSLVSGLHTCPGCVVKNYSDKLASVGYTYISHSDNKIKCTCNKCGSTLFGATNTINNGNKFKCETCLIDKYSKLSESKGFNFVSKYTRGAGTRVKVSCAIDGAIADVSTSELTQANIRCRECEKTKLITELATKKCNFIDIVQVRKEDNTTKLRVTYSNESGEIFEATSGNILEGKFASSKIGHWYQKHCVYLIVNKFNGITYCKIGTADNPSHRLRKLKLTGDAVVHLLQEFDSRFDASSLEVNLHSEFKSSSIDPNIASEFSGAWKLVKDKDGNKYRRLDGITEWFTSDVHLILKNRYSL